MDSHRMHCGFIWAKSQDVKYVGSYLSPYDGSCMFREKLEILNGLLGGMNGGLVVVGDFSAGAIEW